MLCGTFPLVQAFTHSESFCLPFCVKDSQVRRGEICTFFGVILSKGSVTIMTTVS